MDEFTAFESNRRKKQSLMAVVFLAVIMGAWFYPFLGFFIPLCMLLGIGVGLFRGRKWCDWFCPRGSFYDVAVSPFSRKKGIPSLLRKTSFRVGMLFLLMLIMITQLIRLWPDLHKIGMLFATLLTVTTVLGVILGILFHSRSWCSICPIGTITALINKNKYPLKIDAKSCIDCGRCEQVCPIELAPHKLKSCDIELIRQKDCLSCNLCIKACPKQSLSRQIK